MKTHSLATTSQWILIANASLARLFRSDSPTDPLVPLAAMEHPQSRLKGSQLADDHPGHEATDNSSAVAIVRAARQQRRMRRPHAGGDAAGARTVLTWWAWHQRA
jgi:hypothetical protein